MSNGSNLSYFRSIKDRLATSVFSTVGAGVSSLGVGVESVVAGVLSAFGLASVVVLVAVPLALRGVTISFLVAAVVVVGLAVDDVVVFPTGAFVAVVLAGVAVDDFTAVVVEGFAAVDVVLDGAGVVDGPFADLMEEVVEAGVGVELLLLDEGVTDPSVVVVGAGVELV